MNARPPIGLALLVLFQLLPCGATAQDVDESIATRRLHRDNLLICGPRCVQHVLAHYGHEVELLDVIRQIGKPIGAGTSLADLADCLKHYGIHVQLIEIGPAATFDWAHPAIVHLAPSSSADSVGHFVVWEQPRDSEFVTVWNGIEASLQYDRNSFAAVRSGAMILTAPANTKPQLATRLTDSANYAWLVLNLTLFLGVIVLSLKSRPRKTIVALKIPVDSHL